MSITTNDIDLSEIRRPIILNPTKEADLNRIISLMKDRNTRVVNCIEHQIRELIKIERVGHIPEELRYEELLHDQLGEDANKYGNWIFYPWDNTLIHLLAEDDFVKVRTDRNRDKITVAEQTKLKEKVIGIIGMSVGRSIATTAALERVAGTIRLADFDTLDLSNLNRLKAPLRDLGLKKTVSVAREIAEIDPYLNIECFDTGFNDENADEFIGTQGVKLDLLVDECDGLEAKIRCREYAKKHRIPVLMETSDRGMLDVERFDLDPDRPFFHGKLDGIDVSAKSFSKEIKGQVLMRIIDFENLSERARISLPEIGKTLTTWPQLASSVVLGGGTVVNVARKLLLGEEVKSGRYYVDVDQIIKE
ncbi:MAG: ThiF family adenylyltransferase [Flavobacteriales bacterium]